jgi:hypothetical protein
VCRPSRFYDTSARSDAFRDSLDHSLALMRCTRATGSGAVSVPVSKSAIDRNFMTEKDRFMFINKKGFSLSSAL